MHSGIVLSERVELWYACFILISRAEFITHVCGMNWGSQQELPH